jgi:hypothetical protein
MTTDQMAPPVDERLAVMGQQRGVDPAVLERGRRTYLVDCGRCHAIEPITRYSMAQWEELLPEMMVEAKLDYDETEQLELYIQVAHAFLSSLPPSQEAAGEGDESR